MHHNCYFVYLSAEHTYVLESPNMEFVQRTEIGLDRATITNSLNITEFPCLVMLSSGDATGNNATATTMPISLLRCEEPEIEYED